MKYSGRFLLLAIAVGLLVGLSGLPAMAVNISDTHTATDIDSAIRNGIAVIESDSLDYPGGQLFVGYTKTNGTKTSAHAQLTQDTTVEMDTVMGVPTAEMVIQLATDGDSVYRELYVEAFVGWQAGWTLGETYPHPLPPEAGETVPSSDSLVTLQIERIDTGTVEIRLRNTSNYACTMFVSIHFPDTDFNVGWRGSNYREEVNGQMVKFAPTLGQDSTGRSVNVYTGVTPADLVPLDTVVPLSISARLAEDAETYFFLRVASLNAATARDSLCVTVMSHPDSGPEYSQRFARIRSDSGYVGDNDTYYGQGGSQDSVSVWVFVATAIVRVQKRDTIWAPREYVRGLGDAAGRSNDTIPGATIVYEITYDNDGNRRADSLTIIDYLDPNVDFKIGHGFFTGYDTVYPRNGVDTSKTHSRYKGVAGLDTATIVEFATRTDSATFFGLGNGLICATADSSVVETVAAIRIRWPSFGTVYSLQRDQIDDGTYSGMNAIDNLANIGGLDIEGNSNDDSGDCGRIYFAVVIR